MAKVFGILLIVAAIWVGLEVMTEGPEGAFDGAFASVLGDGSDATAAPGSPGQRAGTSVDRAHRDSEERWDRMLGE